MHLIPIKNCGGQAKLNNVAGVATLLEVRVNFHHLDTPLFSVSQNSEVMKSIFQCESSMIVTAHISLSNSTSSFDIQRKKSYQDEKAVAYARHLIHTYCGKLRARDSQGVPARNSAVPNPWVERKKWISAVVGYNRLSSKRSRHHTHESNEFPFTQHRPNLYSVRRFSFLTSDRQQ